MNNNPQKFAYIILSLYGLMSLSACTSNKNLPDVDKAVEVFRRQLDTENYAAIYTDATQEFQRSIDQSHFIKYMQGVHQKLGSFKSTKRNTWRDEYGTNGHLLTAVYETTFANGNATERFIFRMDEPPKLLRYDVSSVAFLLR